MPGLTVDVDPRGGVANSTYVLGGLAEAGHRLRFRHLDCPVTHAMPMEVEGRRLWIDTGDSARVPEGIDEWADRILKVNVEPGHPEHEPLGPLFSIRIWPLPWGYRKVAHLAAGGETLRRALAQVRYQGIARLPLSAYEPGPSEADYLFARFTRWTVQGKEANRRRERYVEAVADLPGTVDVALVADRKARVDLASYLRNTSRSAVVFNTPAAHGCLGWKLGEYLALGKAIVSTPLDRALPAPLVHGEHVHFVDDDVESIRTAVRTIVGDDEYRRHLEANARRWFAEHLLPARVAARIVGPPTGPPPGGTTA